MTEAKTNNRINSIDGLRALCLLGVLLFHIDPQLMPSGYLGVDAFFAISGFVITLQILKLQTIGQFNFSAFYTSRILRLFPALFTTIIITIISSFLISPPFEALETVKSAIAATLSFANVFFFLDTGYFANDVDTKPLLHTWSLSVEEQFYLIWPFLIALLWRNISRIFIVFMFILFMSLLFNIFSIIEYPDATFYLLPFRIYQFVLGGVFAILAFKSNISTKPLYNHNLAVFTSIILFIMWFTDFETASSQLLAQLVTSLIIAWSCYALSQPSLGSNSSKLLTWFPILFIGRKSYAIYLVHWPIIVIYGPLLKGFSYWFSGLTLFICSILFGYILSNYVELPMRYGNKTKRFKLIFTLSLGLIIVVSGLLIQHTPLTKYILNTGKQEVLDPKQANLALYKHIKNRECEFRIQFNQKDIDLTNCLNTGKPIVLILGDSLTRTFVLGLPKLYPDVTFIRVERPGCPPYLGNESNVKDGMFSSLKRCRHESGFIWDFIKAEIFKENIRFDGVIFTGNYMAKDLVMQKYLSNVDRLSTLDIPVAFSGIRPMFTDAPVKLMHSTKRLDINNLDRFLTKSRDGRTQFEINNEIKNYTSQYQNIIFLDMISTLCKDHCAATNDSKMIYVDHQHLSLSGVDMVMKKPEIPKFIAAIKNHFSKAHLENE